MVLKTGQKTFGDILVNKFPLKNVPDVFEINEDEINKNKCCLWILCNFFSFYIKEKFVGPRKTFAGPVDPRCYWSYGASNSLS